MSQTEISSSTEIVCYDKTAERAYVTLGDRAAIAIIHIDDPTNPVVEHIIELDDLGATVNSVACHGGLVAVAIDASLPTDPGSVAFLMSDGQRVRVVTVGPMPDMVTFTPDGNSLVVANEGEPSADGTIDPPGSVSIIDINRNFEVATLLLGSRYPASTTTWFTLPTRLPGLMIEPEYIAVSQDSQTAYVVCQENNAIAKINIEAKELESWHWLGFTEWSSGQSGIDLNGNDGEIKPKSEPVISLRQPDAVIAFPTGHGLRLVTANEGDPRGVWGSDGVKKINGVEYVRSSTRRSEPNALFGSRGISLFDDSLELLWDSEGTFESSLAELFHSGGVQTPLEALVDKRSGKRGIEPESLAQGLVATQRLVFVGLERAGMVATLSYDEPTDTLQMCGLMEIPTPPSSVSAASPEGLAFVSRRDITASPLLLVCDEIHGTLTVFNVNACQPQ